MWGYFSIVILNQMLEVEKIVQSLSLADAENVKSILSDEHAYSDMSIEIFKGYRANLSAEDLQEELSLDLNAFKVFERIIYRSLLSHYKIEDNSTKDVLLTSVFYAIYGFSDKTNQEKSAELEDMFHQMKQHKIEQSSAELLLKLAEIHKDSPLEAVYQHLHLKYKTQKEEIFKMVEEFERFNQLISIDTQIKFTQIRQIIRSYKKLRAMAAKSNNSTSNAILELSKLSLVVLLKQEQLLIEGHETVEDLKSSTQKLIASQPFGFLKFYLQNIFNQIDVIELAINGNPQLAEERLQALNNKSLEAFNFNFPSKLITQTLGSANAYKKQLQPSKYLELLPSTTSRIFQNDPLYHGGFRLSCS